jgi:predicted cupin superfamily sugar epimerase
VKDRIASDLSAGDVVKLLALAPHPEGGHFRETFRDADPSGGRSHSTAILYLLAAGERSHWHRVDAAEMWHHYAGAPLRLSLCPEGGSVTHRKLGSDFRQDEELQIVVPKSWWQSAESLGAWTLVGCTVAPGFEFAGFEMAPPDFSPG